MGPVGSILLVSLLEDRTSWRSEVDNGIGVIAECDLRA